MIDVETLRKSSAGSGGTTAPRIPSEHDDETQVEMYLRFRVQSSIGVMKMARFEHDIEVGGAPLVVRVSASKGGKKIEIPLRVTNVSFDPEGTVTGELADDGTTIEFTATAEGDATATIEAEYQKTEGTGTLTAELLLHGVPPAEEVPDTLELDFGDGAEEPAPEEPRARTGTRAPAPLRPPPPAGTGGCRAGPTRRHSTSTGTGPCPGDASRDAHRCTGRTARAPRRQVRSAEFNASTQRPGMIPGRSHDGDVMRPDKLNISGFDYTIRYEHSELGDQNTLRQELNHSISVKYNGQIRNLQEQHQRRETLIHEDAFMRLITWRSAPSPSACPEHGEWGAGAVPSIAWLLIDPRNPSRNRLDHREGR
jgi:hypothetical protein